jgi:hypothetical protein
MAGKAVADTDSGSWGNPLKGGLDDAWGHTEFFADLFRSGYRGNGLGLERSECRRG